MEINSLNKLFRCCFQGHFSDTLGTRNLETSFTGGKDTIALKPTVVCGATAGIHFKGNVVTVSYMRQGCAEHFVYFFLIQGTIIITEMKE
jgi:hypothetical protein